MNHNVSIVSWQEEMANRVVSLFFILSFTHLDKMTDLIKTVGQQSFCFQLYQC